MLADDEQVGDLAACHREADESGDTELHCRQRRRVGGEAAAEAGIEGVQSMLDSVPPRGIGVRFKWIIHEWGCLLGCLDKAQGSQRILQKYHTVLPNRVDETSSIEAQNKIDLAKMGCIGGLVCVGVANA